MAKKKLQVRKEYLEKLERIRKEKPIYIGSIEDFKKRYGIKEKSRKKN